MYTIIVTYNRKGGVYTAKYGPFETEHYRANADSSTYEAAHAASILAEEIAISRPRDSIWQKPKFLVGSLDEGKGRKWACTILGERLEAIVTSSLDNNVKVSEGIY